MDIWRLPVVVVVLAIAEILWCVPYDLEVVFHAIAFLYTSMPNFYVYPSYDQDPYLKIIFSWDFIEMTIKSIYFSSYLCPC